MSRVPDPGLPESSADGQLDVDELILVSIDDHVVEPPDMFDRHIPAKYKDRAPHIVMGDNGIEKWVFEGQEMGSMGLNAVVTWPKEEWGFDPVGFAEMRPGAYDIHERVRDMNRNGILASMCFPTFAGFSGHLFQYVDDKDLVLAVVRAYNDWHIDEWCGAYPGRFVPLAVPPIFDPERIADEVRRIAAKGCHAITMPELPHMQGLPSYNDLDYWDPFFRAASEEQVVMCMHIGQGFAAINGSPDGPIDNLIILATQVSTIAAQDLLWGGAMRKYPDLKMAWSEAGIGWIPFFLDRCDRHYTNQRWLGHDFGGKLPSDIFREHSLACYVTDPTALKVRNEIGIDIIAWECDYPHSDSIWPDAPEYLLAELNAAGATDDEIHKITWQNSSRFFNHDTFKHIPRERANVASLRALSPDVDTTTRSRAEWRQRYDAAHAG
jgi:predicted TIM-barrel fold metal-dependent hydrolase